MLGKVIWKISICHTFYKDIIDFHKPGDPEELIFLEIQKEEAQLTMVGNHSIKKIVRKGKKYKYTRGEM